MGGALIAIALTRGPTRYRYYCDGMVRVPVDQPLVVAPACPSPLPAQRIAEWVAAVHGLAPVQDYAQEFCLDALPLPACPSGAVPPALRRPIVIPSVQPGGGCPVTAPNPKIWSRLAPGLGSGPVAPVGLGTTSTLRYREFGSSSSPAAWGGNKVLWVAARSYRGPILIRGMQVDGDRAVGFDLGGDAVPTAELRLPPGAPAGGERWRQWPSSTRVQGPGCYAYQVDGTTFSYVIVFRARP